MSLPPVGPSLPTLPSPASPRRPPHSLTDRSLCSLLPAQDYALQADTYRCSLEPTQAGSAPKRPQVAPLQESIQAQVRRGPAGTSSVASGGG